MAKEQNKKTTVGLSDEEIIEGLRNRDPQITRDYFYGVCRIAYHIYNKHYGLKWKMGLDFYSIAHEYYLSLDKHNFRQLEDLKPGMTLKTWMINGFRFVLLDRLKDYNKEQCLQSFEERLEKASLRFDIPDNNFSEDFRNTVYEICSVIGRDHRSSIILQMMLIEGFKGKEVAAQLGITPSAVTQKYHRLMEDVVIPYFKRYYVAPPCEVKSEIMYDKEFDAKMSISASPLSLSIQITPIMEKDYSKSHPTTSPHSSPTRFSSSAATSPVCTEAVPHAWHDCTSVQSSATVTVRRDRAMPSPPCRVAWRPSSPMWISLSAMPRRIQNRRSSSPR